MVNTEETCTVCVFQNYICVLKRKKETYVSAMYQNSQPFIVYIYEWEYECRLYEYSLFTEDILNCSKLIKISTTDFASILDHIYEKT